MKMHKKRLLCLANNQNISLSTPNTELALKFGMHCDIDENKYEYPEDAEEFVQQWIKQDIIKSVEYAGLNKSDVNFKFFPSQYSSNNNNDNDNDNDIFVRGIARFRTDDIESLEQRLFEELKEYTREWSNDNFTPQSINKGIFATKYNTDLY